MQAAQAVTNFAYTHRYLYTGAAVTGIITGAALCASKYLGVEDRTRGGSMAQRVLNNLRDPSFKTRAQTTAAVITASCVAFLATATIFIPLRPYVAKLIPYATKLIRHGTVPTLYLASITGCALFFKNEDDPVFSFSLGGVVGVGLAKTTTTAFSILAWVVSKSGSAASVVSNKYVLGGTALTLSIMGLGLGAAIYIQRQNHDKYIYDDA